MNLVEVDLLRKVRSLASDIGHRDQRVACDFALNIEMPLLHVGPLSFGGDGCELTGASAQREEFRCSVGAAADAGVAADIGLQRRNDQRRIAFERFGVGIVAVGMLEKNSIAGADSHLAVAPGIEGKANARRGIEQVPAHATGMNSVAPAMHHAGQGGNTLPRSEDQRAIVQRDRWRNRGIVGRGLEVVSLAFGFVITAHQADAHAEIQREPPADVPIILQIRLKNFVAIVVFDVLIGLGKIGDIPDQQVGKAVAGTVAAGIADRGIPGKTEIAVGFFLGRFVFFNRRKVSAELQIVLAQNLGRVVVKRVCRIRIVPGQKSGIDRDVAEIVRPADADGRNRAIEAILKKSRHRHRRWPLPRGPCVVEMQVIGGIAENKFVEQRGRECCAQICDHADAGAVNHSANRGDGRTRVLGAGGNRIRLLP